MQKRVLAVAPHDNCFPGNRGRAYLELSKPGACMTLYQYLSTPNAANILRNMSRRQAWSHALRVPALLLPDCLTAHAVFARSLLKRVMVM